MDGQSLGKIGGRGLGEPNWLAGKNGPPPMGVNPGDDASPDESGRLGDSNDNLGCGR
jgi:hypothetical protein